MGEVDTHEIRGIMVESSSPNISHRQQHQFNTTQEDEAESSKPSATTTATAVAEPPTSPLTPTRIVSEDQGRGAATPSTSSPPRQHRHHSRTSPVNISTSTVYTEDARDEEEDAFDAATRSSLGDDPYVYSDDSASLSDAYFFPQADEEYHARPPRYSYRNDEEDFEQEDRAALLHYPLASYYGSMHSAAAAAASMLPEHQRSTSPLWVAGSIQEDSEMPTMLGHHHTDVAAASLLQMQANNDPLMQGRKEHRRQRRHKSKHHNSRKRTNTAYSLLKQQQHQNSVNRERAVTAIRGRPQDATRTHDGFWAVLFLLQLCAVIVCAIRFGYTLLAETTTNSDHLFWRHFFVPRYEQPYVDVSIQYNFTTHEIQYSDDMVAPSDHPLTLSTANTSSSSSPPDADFAFAIAYQNVIALISITGLYACVITYLSFGFMLVLARALIQIMLVFSVVLALAWGLIGLTLDPYGVISIMGFSALLLTLGYTMYNWSSIPFATTNLYTALCAMRCTADITIFGFVCLLVAFAWCFVWGIAFIGIVNSLNIVECDHKDACGPHVANRHIPLYLLLLFSFHWTNTVIKNITRVTVASVVGTWWFYPGDIGPFCTPAVMRPLLRSLTKSLGSICLGSLVVQPAQALVAFSNCCCFLLGNPESSSCKNVHQRDSLSSCSRKGDILVSHGDEEVESAVDSVGLFRRLCGLMDRLNFCLRSCNRWSYTYIGMCKLFRCDLGQGVSPPRS